MRSNALRTLFHPHAGFLDDFVPARHFRSDERLKLLRCAADGFGAIGRETRDYVALLETACDALIQTIDDGTRLLYDLEPVVAENLDRHLGAAKDWMPHEYVPFSDGRNFPGIFEDGEAWHAEQSKVSDIGKIALVEICCYYQMRDNSNPPDTAPPEYLDWDAYTGPAPLRPYNKIVHPRGWRAFIGQGSS